MVIVSNYNDTMINFKSQITQKLLGYFFINSHKKHYVNELARILDLDPGNMSRKLKQLENEGVLTSEFSGKQRYYSLNKKYPWLRETKKMFDASFGLKEILAKKFKTLDGLKEAYIFGSYAKGNFGSQSDIDLLLIGSHSSMEATRKILPLQNQLGREFNAIDMSREEYEKRKKEKDPFLANILSGKIIKIV
jgi:predicted nucleotidyltransferase